ncbi:MAG: hypothetical protein Kow00129_09980 [Thermoleophilia bacterium]
MAVSDKTDVYLISGFLGAGKTTFLNRLIKRVPDDITFLILMNEFGEVGLDGTLIEGEDLDMLEISKGSIFCACVKTDFIKGLHEIAHSVKPDVMLIETTGVANPHDLDRDLKLPIFNGVFRLRDKFCLIDAGNFLDTYASFLAIEKQLESSDVFIINKIDEADETIIEQIKEVVREFNPNPRFYEAVYADVDFEELFETGALRGRLEEVEDSEAATGADAAEPPMRLNDEQLEEYIENLLQDESAQVTPPDRLLSTVVPWGPGTEEDFRGWIDGLPRVVRAKGVVELDGELRLFSMVNGRWTLGDYQGRRPAEAVSNRVVFISRPEEIKEIERVHASEEVS